MNMRASAGTQKNLFRAAVAVGTFAALGACINLDQATQVKDLRVLAMRVEPPELLFNFFHIFPYEQRMGFPLGPYNINARVLAVDPQGREVNMSVRLCPEQVDETSPLYDPGCEGYVVRSNAAPEEIRAVVPLVEPTAFSSRGDPALGGEIPVSPMAMTFTERAMDYMLPHTPDGEFDLVTALLFPTFPSLVARVAVPGTRESEVAYKRFTVALDISPDGIPADAREGITGIFEGITGVPFCPDVDPEADVNCIKRRRANRNPTITRMLWRRSSEDEILSNDNREPDPNDVTDQGRFKDITGRIEVAPGQGIRLRPVSAADDAEPYQAFIFDLQATRLVVRNYREDLVFSWYTTVGEIDESTTTQFTRTADANYRVSPDAPDGPAHVWVVLRDQRGGVDWRRIDFMIKTPQVGGGGGGPFGLPF